MENEQTILVLIPMVIPASQLPNFIQTTKIVNQQCLQFSQSGIPNVQREEKKTKMLNADNTVCNAQRPNGDNGNITSKQMDFVNSICKKNHLNENEVCKAYGIDRIESMNKQQANDFIRKYRQSHSPQNPF